MSFIDVYTVQILYDFPLHSLSLSSVSLFSILKFLSIASLSFYFSILSNCEASKNINTLFDLSRTIEIIDNNFLKEAAKKSFCSGLVTKSLSAAGPLKKDLC